MSMGRRQAKSSSTIPCINGRNLDTQSTEKVNIYKFTKLYEKHVTSSAYVHNPFREKTLISSKLTSLQLEAHKIMPNKQQCQKAKTTSEFIYNQNHLKISSSTSPWSTNLVNLSVSKNLPPKQNQSPQRTKVFLSNQQTNSMVECGCYIPGAPPATPTPSQTQYCEYVPSLHDIRGQRALTEQLARLKNRQLKNAEEKKSEIERQVKLFKLEENRQLKHNQRNMIYALNKLMREAELNKFIEFKRQHDLNG